MSKIKLCVYAGTFNPIHNAHLALCEYVKDEISANKILFIPSYNPPHRENGVVEAHHRLKMVELSIKNNPDFEISDIEFQKSGKSYTYLTILELYNLYEIKGKINFIIGTDAIEKIDSWFEAEKLAELVHFVVVPRGENFDFSALFEKIKLNLDYEILNAPFLDISSTMIRERIKNKKSIKYLVHSEVESYIKTNQLFQG